MPYTLCILGCGTMGIAVLSGVLDNLSNPHAPNSSNHPESDSAPSTPMGSMILDTSLAVNGGVDTSVPNR